MTAPESASVLRVQAALAAAGSAARIITLGDSARTAVDAAGAVGCELGAIVKSLVFVLDCRPVMVLIAGDRRCEMAALNSAFGLVGKAMRADADLVRRVTGFAIGGVAPIGHDLPVIVDKSLARFEIVWSAAGHPHRVFGTSPDELLLLANGRWSDSISTAI